MSLEDEVNRLQSEIERLKSTMNNVPRKSEFSKYVEVKLQNATLQVINLLSLSLFLFLLFFFNFLTIISIVLFRHKYKI